MLRFIKTFFLELFQKEKEFEHPNQITWWLRSLLPRIRIPEAAFRTLRSRRPVVLENAQKIAEDGSAIQPGEIVVVRIIGSEKKGELIVVRVTGRGGNLYLRRKSAS